MARRARQAERETSPSAGERQLAPLLDGRRRVVIESVWPEVDGGRFPVKRVVGEQVRVEADVFTDGHDIVTCMLLHRRAGDADWSGTPMFELGNDRYSAAFEVAEQGVYEYTLAAWIDAYATWARGLRRKVDAGQDVSLDLEAGAELVTAAAARAVGREKDALVVLATALAGAEPVTERVQMALAEQTTSLLGRHPDRELGASYE